MGGRSRAEIERSLSPKRPADGLPAPPRVPGGTGVTPEAIERRWQLLRHARPESRAALADERCVAEAERYRANIDTDSALPTPYPHSFPCTLARRAYTPPAVLD